MPHTLHVAFQNVNHSPQHTHALLEQCASANVDVVCIQEPWFGPIRPIPSASPAGPAERTDNNMLYGTQLHPAWQLIVPQADARVVCHVSRRLTRAVVSLNAEVKHRDCMVLTIRPDPSADPISILNIYNDTQNSAIEYLCDIAERLPDIAIMGGDYNTHSRVWDPDYPPDSAARTGEVLDLHARLGLRLLSPPSVPTHFPHRQSFRPTVIDLVWVPSDRPPELYDLRVAPEERGLSDHAVLHARIPAGQWSIEGAPTITPKSDEEKAFLTDVTAAVLARLPPDFPLATMAELATAVDTLFGCVHDAWNAHAQPSRVCSKSKLWWDGSCSAARDNLTRARHRLEEARRTTPRLVPAAQAAVRRAFKRFKSAIRLRRRAHMDERIDHVANEQRRVWDLMAPYLTCGGP
ncbi:Endonuclease/exonuclease/phosphatase [Lenzites betulinus]|nr:Endonuclease/exonuclease/phosphatase [Lenzites betulinus]